MNVSRSLLLSFAASISLLALIPGAQAKPEAVIGVSWSNFQEERWKIDEAAIKKQLALGKADYIGADAQSNPQKQLADVESLIARGATALIVLAQDAQAIQPAIAKAKAEKIPVLGYDRLIEVPGVFYLTFDNIEVGRMMAREIQRARPTGNYVFIKGYHADPNADFLAQGSKEVLKAALDKGEIKIVGEQYTDRWLPENAQKNMEQILTANNNKIDAVIAANDGTAGGAIAAMSAQGLTGIPVSGQDADQAALNRIARGLQTVTIWKDARTLGKKAAEVALQLAKGTAMDKIPGSFKWASGPNKVALDTILLTPVAVTRQNLGEVISAGWSTKEQVCRGVTQQPPAACQ